MLLALFAPAHAFTLAEAARWDTPSDPRVVVWADRAEGPRLVVLGADALRVIDPDTGVAVAEVALGGNALVERDPDGDGVTELWACADDGIWRIDWTGDVLAAPVQVAATACSAMVALADGVATAGTTVSTWVDDGAGGLVGPADAGFTTLEEPLLAFDGTDLAATDRGAASVQVMGSRGVSSLAAGGTVTALGVVDGALAWSLGDGAAIAFADGTTVGVEAGPGAFTAGDIDGDGVGDLAVVHPDDGIVGLWRGAPETERWWPAAVGARSPTIADRDGDGCGEVAWVEPDAAAVEILTVTDCGDAWDHDGDGWSAEDGDCDDTDASVSPEAAETCDGVDDDCDGVVDPFGSTVRIDGPTVVDEGDAFVLTAIADGCPVAFTWDFPTLPTFDCTAAAGELACDAFDDDFVTFGVSTTDDVGATLATAAQSLSILNVAPTLADVTGGCGTSPVAEDTATVHPGEHYEEQLTFVEPGDDTVTVSAVDLPPGMTLSATGLVTYDVTDELGTFTPTLTLSDEDGGVSSKTVTIDVREPDPGFGECGPSSGLCCGSSSLGVIGSLATLLARRRL